jgi:S-(hydroxymethyl)glutathione dehydrogenase/alcohol dehydrogenase
MSIPKIMKAAILAELNQPLIIDEVELPDCLDYGQVLVKIAFTGICGSQIGEIQGRKGPDNYLPHLLGHEASGTVAATGPGVRFVAPEDRVVLHWRKGNGIEAAPPIYRWRGKRLNAGFVTTFNEYAVVSENRVTKVDHDLPMVDHWRECCCFGRRGRGAQYCSGGGNGLCRSDYRCGSI